MMRRDRNGKLGGFIGEAMQKATMACLFLVLASVFTTDLHAAEKLPKVPLSVKPLNLSIPPSREEIMAAGQLGGQLYPTHEIQDKEKEKEINKSFAEAIQEWNNHEYKKAIKLF